MGVKECFTVEILCSPSNPVNRKPLSQLPQTEEKPDKCKDCVLASICKPDLGLMPRPVGTPKGWSEGESPTKA